MPVVRVLAATHWGSHVLVNGPLALSWRRGVDVALHRALSTVVRGVVRLLAASRALDVRGPVDAVTQRLAAAAEDRERPKPLVGAEDLIDIIDRAHVIGAPVWLALLIEVLNRRLVGRREEYVELEEESQQHRNDASQNVAHLDEQAAEEFLSVAVSAREVESVNLPLHSD